MVGKRTFFLFLKNFGWLNIEREKLMNEHTENIFNSLIPPTPIRFPNPTVTRRICLHLLTYFLLLRVEVSLEVISRKIPYVQCVATNAWKIQIKCTIWWNINQTARINRKSYRKLQQRWVNIDKIAMNISQILILKGKKPNQFDHNINCHYLLFSYIHNQKHDNNINQRK